jgi:soluble lytic murein transglycosylase
MRLALLAAIGSAGIGSTFFGGGCRHAEPPLAPAAAIVEQPAPEPFVVHDDPSDEAVKAWLFPRDEGITTLGAALKSPGSDAGSPFAFAMPATPSAPLVCALRLLGGRVIVAEAPTLSLQNASSDAVDGSAPRAAVEGDAGDLDRDAMWGDADDNGDAANQADAGDSSDASTSPEPVRCASDAFMLLERGKNLIEVKQYAAALALLDASTWPSLLVDDALRARARALDGLERRAEAAPLWQKLASGRGARVQEACVRGARDLVALGSKEGAKDARALVLRAYAEAPAWAEAQEGLDKLFAEASKLAGEKPERDLVTRAKEAQAWRDAGDDGKAKRIANDVVKKSGVAPGEASCRARTVLAQEAPKGQRAAAWSHAIEACGGSELQASALFSGAKASFSEKKSDEAKQRYERVIQTFPEHRLADDSALALAKIQLDEGQADAAEKGFVSMATRHPTGDMVPEGTFKAALLRVQRGAFAEARSLVLDVGSDDNDVHWSSGGRGRHLRAFCSERLGDVAAAKLDYAEVIRRHPYSFWMLAAYARLRALDANEAVAALKSLESAEGDAFAPLDDDALLLAREAFVAGRYDLLRDLSSYGGFGARPKEAGWAFSWLLDAAGFETLGHGRPRVQGPQFLSHAPHGMARLGWMASFPTPHEELVRAESTKRGVPSSLVWAIMREESAFKVEVKSSAKAYGLMQLIVPTAQRMAQGEGVRPTERSLVDPKVNIALGTKLLGVLRKGYGANPILAVPAYNAGGGAVNRWLEQRKGLPFELWVESIPYEETRGYVKRVTTSWLAYARLYAPEELAQVMANPWPDAAPMSSASDAP